MGGKKKSKVQQQQPKEQPKEQAAPKPAPSNVIMGIDFGAHYCCVGVMRNERIEICPNQQGNRTTPSIVAFVGEDRLVGDEAKGQIDRNPLNTVYDVKKLIGLPFSDQSLQNEIKKFPYKVIDNNDNALIEVNYKGKAQTFKPVEIASMILQQIKTTADNYMGADMRRAVITVPSEFSLEQRNVVKEAAQMAGLNVVRIINEHTAVALAYGLDISEVQPRQPQNTVVFDLGGSGLSVSVMSVGRDSAFEVVANVFDHSLSGEAFDHAIVTLLATEFKRKYRMDVTESTRAVAKLKSAAERAKKNLSSMTQASIELDSLYEGCDLFTSITRAKFEDAAGDLIRGARRSLTAVIEKAGVSKDTVERVIMVGGGSKIPAIHQLVVDFFGGKQELIAKTVAAEEAVCIGATMEAHILEQHGSSHADRKMLNGTGMQLHVTPVTIGIENGDGTLVPIIPAKTRLPAIRNFKLTNHTDNQTKLALTILQQSTDSSSSPDTLARYLLDIVAAPKGTSQIDITFKIDHDGLLDIITPSKSFQIKPSK